MTKEQSESKRPEIITIRVKDTDLKWKLKEAAAKEKTTVSALVEKFLTDGLKGLEGNEKTQRTNERSDRQLPTETRDDEF